MELVEDGWDVTEKGEGGLANAVDAAELFGRYVNLNGFDVWVELGWLAVVKNPVETSSKEQDTVSLFQCCGPCRARVEGMRIWDHPFAHWCRQEGDVVVVDERAKDELGARVRCAFANHY